MPESELEEVTAAPPSAAPAPAPAPSAAPPDLRSVIGNRAMRAILEDQYAFMSTRARPSSDPNRSGNIIRRRQSLYYRSSKIDEEFVGMECNTVAMLYMLQSYGLIPPDMRLEEFEEAFTPVNVDVGISADNSARAPEEGVVKVNGVEQGVPGIDMMTPLTGGNRRRANWRLRGGFGQPAFIPSSQGAKILQKLLIAFWELPQRDPRYAFLQRDKEARTAMWTGTSKEIAARKNLPIYDSVTARGRDYEGGAARSLIRASTKVANLGGAVAKGLVPEAYFNAGHTIYAGINEHYDLKGVTHYILLTGVAQRVSFQGKPYTIYEADDPYYGRIYVLAPYVTLAPLSGMPGLKPDKPYMLYQPPGKESRTLFSFANLAFGVEAPELHPR